LSSAHVPDALKTAVITPILKKPSLDPDAPGNYRPVSGLPYSSKLLEKVVSARLKTHRSSNDLYEPCQSAYRAGHSTETAAVKITDDIRREIDQGRVVVLVLLDLSAAFDTVHHDLLLDQLSSRFGLTGNALEWVASYLGDRTQSVCVNGITSSKKPLLWGVPQGSVLGPELFSDYSAPIMDIIRAFGLMGHCYADDTQIYDSFQPDVDEDNVLDRIHKGIEAIRRWMCTHKLKLNDAKTECIILGSAASLKKVRTTSIVVGGQVIQCSKSVRNIGAYLDQHMTMDNQVSNMCKSAWINLHRIRQIRQYVTSEQTKTLVHAYVTSRLDQFNALLCGLPESKLDKLRQVQHAAARLITGTRKYDHITRVMKSLHWLPVEQRIIFKVLLLVFKALTYHQPAYLKDLLCVYRPKRCLRSMKENKLVVPRTKLATYGDRSFSVIAPKLWNDLPPKIKACTTVPSFKSALKTHLFKIAYCL